MIILLLFFTAFIFPMQLLPSFEIGSWTEDDVVSRLLLMPHLARAGGSDICPQVADAARGVWALGKSN